MIFFRRLTRSRLATPRSLALAGAVAMAGAVSINKQYNDGLPFQWRRAALCEEVTSKPRDRQRHDAVTEHAKACGAWRSDWDGCGGENGEDGENKRAKRVLVLIRHGQYVSADKDEDRVLTPLGVKQAKQTGQRLRALVDAKVLPPIDCVYYSTMARATQTAAVVLDSLEESTPREPCNLIREGAVCRPVPESTMWQPTADEFRTDNTRVEKAVNKYLHRADCTEERTTVFICHGNVIRYWCMRLLQLPVCAWLRTAVYNGSITILEIRPNGNVSLRTMGDAGHMEPEMISYN